MNIADRIHNLRKTSGLSQEDLADKIGVSRQAVSKWESEQSIPDIDKIIILSDIFEVTTDYILKGIDPIKNKTFLFLNSNTIISAATALNLLGVIIACLVWYEQQLISNFIIGAIGIVLGCTAFIIGLQRIQNSIKKKVIYKFLKINIWIIIYLPLSVLFSLIVVGYPVPFPVFIGPIFYTLIFLAIYIFICITALLILKKITT